MILLTHNLSQMMLRQQVKELDQENRRLKKEKDFLEEASIPARFTAKQSEPMVSAKVGIVSTE